MDLNEIFEPLDMEFYLQRESVQYKLSRGSSGMQINVKYCPACGDSRWRAYLNEDTGRGNCFVCDETFSKAKFIHIHQGHEKSEWGKTFDIAKEVLKEQGWRPKRMMTAAVEIGAIKLPFSQELPLPSDENLQYLTSRNISFEMTKFFHLRWCQFGWWDILDENGKKARQIFDNRIIIPIFDLDGKLVTFQGRDLSGVSPRKYLFPKGLPGTGRFLFNGQNVHLTSEVVIGEGVFDVMAIKAALDEDVGLRHIVPVGSFGKHLSFGSSDGNDQLGRFIRLKAGGLKTVTIMWDGEEKALVAALSAAKLLVGIGLVARIARLPAGKDPNEVLPEIVRNAYYEATLWTPKIDVIWRIKNPYSSRSYGKFLDK
ncbi:MAG: hypothetical protein ACEQSB_00435 [Undibacterium sp.]